MMKLDWIVHPAMQYGLLAAGLGLCLYLFFTLKLEIRAIERRWKVREGELAQAISAVRAALDGARAELHEMGEQTGMLVAPTATRSGLNLSKRGQVLQMNRRGQSAEQIAAALGLPITEVDLLIKVHQIVLEQVR
jgi:hypothetical protein